MAVGFGRTGGPHLRGDAGDGVERLFGRARQALGQRGALLGRQRLGGTLGVIVLFAVVYVAFFATH